MAKKTVHLICNAHLDPIWLWQWPEGAAEAMSTFRIAAEMCENYNTFVFNHNEVILYKWIQEYEPQLFELIKKLVKAGKWHIMGGWYLQPDCNMPSGEGFVRQIMAGRKYFKKHFNVEPTSAINFDSFGHSRGLVQIMAKSGYDSYLFGRPMPEWIDLPGDFMWKGFDGSQILARRYSGWYNTMIGEAAKTIKKRIGEFLPETDTLAILWGMGNHGGGPSKKDLKDVNKLIKKAKDVEIKHSTPDDYFKEISKRKKDFPIIEKQLNPWAPGCYTSCIRIKQKYRQLENEVFSLEKMAAAATANGLMKYPKQELDHAIEDMLFAQFHDILPGSSIKPAEEDAISLMDHGLEITSRLKARAFFALSSGQPKAKANTIPIMIYNPHPYKVKDIFQCEFNLPDMSSFEPFKHIQVYNNNKLLNSQDEKEYSNIPIQWRKRVLFEAELEPSQMNRFDCKIELIKEKPKPKVKRDRNNNIVFKNDNLHVVINTRTGLIDKYRVDGVDYVGPGAFAPVVIEDNENPWGALDHSYTKRIGKFKLMSKNKGSQYSSVSAKNLDSVRVIEDGPVRTLIEVMLEYGSSVIRQYYSLPKSGSEIGVDMVVEWREKGKMLKLAVPSAFDQGDYLGQTAYGTEQLEVNGRESVAQKWTALLSRENDAMLGFINDGTYGSDLNIVNGQATVSLSLIRSAVYSNMSNDSQSIVPEDRAINYIDYGIRNFSFWFKAGKINEISKTIERDSLVKNEKPYILSFFPSGQGKKPKPIITCTGETLQVSALKFSENGKELIFRLFNPTKKAITSTLNISAYNKKIKVKLDPFEIQTLGMNLRSKKHKLLDLMEKPAKKMK